MESTLVARHHFPPPLHLSRQNPPNCAARCCLRTTWHLQSSTNGRPATATPSIPVHKVTINDRHRGVVREFLVPEDQYTLHTAESQNISLPFTCRHGCSTSCEVRVKEGQIRQPEALGISAELKSKVYLLQFRRYFARGPIISFVCAMGSEEPNDYEGGITTDVPPVYFELQERDDYTLELAMADE